MKPDLTLLYSQLGLPPDCTLAELQLAYRRKISGLKRARAAGQSETPEAAAALRDLIALYTTATRFHRRYGRLPGANPHRTWITSRSYPVIAGLSRDAIPVRQHAQRGALARFALGIVVGALVVVFGLLAFASGEWFR